MQRPADQQPRQLIGGAATIQKYRIAVVDQSDGGRRQSAFFFSHSAGCWASKWGNLGEMPVYSTPPWIRRADPLLLQLVQIAANRRFRDRKLLGQLRQRGKSPHADQFQQTVSTFFGQHGIWPWEMEENNPLYLRVSHRI